MTLTTQFWDPSIMIIFIIIIALIYLLSILIKIEVKIELDEKIDSLANNELAMTPEQFFRMRNMTMDGRGSPLYSSTRNFAGVYILYNQSKNLYYVGQGKKVFDRVNSHFTGRGNGDVYADYKYGDKFIIRMIALSKSGYRSINALERHAIARYKSFSRGYNKTRGNRG